MKYVVTGGAGNISRPLTENLLQAGHEVTVIGRNPEHLKPLTEKGAQAAIGSVEDAAFLKNAFSGADAVYLMFPPQYGGMDFQAYQQTAAGYAEAIKSNNIKNVVVLSSIGAHLEKGCGPVSGIYLAEQELRKLADVNILFLRPGFFYINFFANVGMIKHMNIFGANYGDSNTKMVLSHPNDIAQAAAQALQELNFKGHSVLYLDSDVRTTGDITKAIGNAIGKPELPWVEFTDEQAYEGMKQAGVPDLMAKRYVEMGSAMRSGIMWEDRDSHPSQTHGKIKIEDFAKQFAEVYAAN
jgi:uncharacterized protein YbjT (DUF2867 family)